MKLRTIITTVYLSSAAACATIMQGSQQPVALSSTPAGASISVDGKEMGTTPATVRLSRKDSHVVSLALDGYLPYQMTLEKKTSGWVWGNIVFGGVVGVVVDASTGAMYRLTPGTVDANMETRTAVVDGKRTIQVAIVMRADPTGRRSGNSAPSSDHRGATTQHDDPLRMLREGIVMLGSVNQVRTRLRLTRITRYPSSRSPRTACVPSRRTPPPARSRWARCRG